MNTSGEGKGLRGRRELEIRLEDVQLETWVAQSTWMKGEVGQLHCP